MGDGEGEGGEEGLVQQLFELLFGEAAGGGPVRDGVAEILKRAGGFAAQAVVIAGGDEDGDLLSVALDEDGLALGGVEEGGEVGVGIACGVAHGKTSVGDCREWGLEMHLW